MPAIIDSPAQRAGPGGRWKRFAWFVLIYGLSLAAALVVAYGLKLLIPGV